MLTSIIRVLAQIRANSDATHAERKDCVCTDGLSYLRYDDEMCDADIDFCTEE